MSICRQKKARAEQFRAQLRLIGSRWQIVGLDLPDDLKEQLARQLIKATEELLPNTENPNQGPIFCNLSCLCEYAPKMKVVRLAEHLIWMTVPLERDDFQNYT